MSLQNTGIQQKMYDGFANLFRTNRRVILKTIITSIAIIFSCITVLNIILSNGTAEYNIQKYFFLYSLPVFLVFALLLNLGRETEMNLLFLKVVGLLIIITLFIYYYVTSTNTFFNVDILSNYSLITLITVIGFAIMYKYLTGYLESLKGVPGFIAQLLFYVPCMIWELWDYILSEIHLTPYSIHLFILFELLLIVLYGYLPNISNKMNDMDNAIQVVDKIVHLDNKHIVLSSDDLKQNTDILQSDYLTNYAISMWVYINPQSPTDPAYNKETEIFSYGFTDKDGIQQVKPMIRYYGGGGGSDQTIERNKFVFYLSKYPPSKQYNADDSTFYDVTLPNQKWNQIVMNYNRNNVDIFINGELSRSFVLTNDMPQYNDLDTISIGDEKGLKGGICNVVYYKHSLSKDQIVTHYNSKMLSNPPI
jgi:hypothetical protein